MKRIIGLLILGMFVVGIADAAPPVRSDTYVSQSVIDPAAVTRNEDAIFTYLQAGVDTFADNSVTSAKIIDGAIVNADINSSAAIADGKVDDDLTIDGGTIDDSVIGGSTAAAADFTTVDATGAVTATGLLVSTSLQVAETVIINSVKDEDTLASDDAAALATQQSIKAYTETGNFDSRIKGWINLTMDTAYAINDSFNVSGIVDDGAGSVTVTWDTDFANANYAVVANTSQGRVAAILTVAVGSTAFDSRLIDGTETLADSDPFMVIAIGDQ